MRLMFQASPACRNTVDPKFNHRLNYISLLARYWGDGDVSSHKSKQ